MEANFQRIQKSCDSQFELARRYYTIVFGLNDIHVTNNELNLIAYSAVQGTISTSPIRKQFCKDFNVPAGSVYNMVSRLQKLSILQKDKDNKVRVNSAILPDFTRDMLLVIKMITDGNT